VTGWPALLAACAVWLWTGPARAVGQRGGRADRPVPLTPSAERGSAQGILIEHGGVRGALCGLSSAAVGMAVGGPAVAVVGAVVGLMLSAVIARLEPPSVRRRRERIDRDLPLAIELLAACTAAGLAIEPSVDVVSMAIGGPLGEILGGHAARVRLGGDPVADWRRLHRDPQLASLARSMLRSAESGAALVDSLHRLAADSRLARATVLQRRARGVGVRAAGPLGVCFLPSFMLIGVVPTVVGGFSHLLA
jgi:Flp pilus assembly protein TadB